MENRYELNKELAQMLKGGVIMDRGSSRCLCGHGSGADPGRYPCSGRRFPYE